MFDFRVLWMLCQVCWALPLDLKDSANDLHDYEENPVQELERLKRGPPMFDLPRTWRVKKLDNSINQDTQDLPPQPAGKLTLGSEDNLNLGSMGLEKRLEGHKFTPGWRIGKRSGYEASGRRMFDESFAKRSSPRRESGQFVWDNILRSPQGFRFHDNFGDYSLSSRFKREKLMRTELNSIPLMGKRQESSDADFLSQSPLMQRVPRGSEQTQRNAAIRKHLEVMKAIYNTRI
ncbi:uncharacterized protein LOC111714465 isoform X2 [Eurytemora carolleeae]|uniref:uncharacterized protein LOC111714465 isoform X2 n=1 Tax=Eurytemora carolleeae TaxID=1294199 RepID=UPI000C770F6E|nr:uncharacterized protein LOC111714465 isoform X2 [Eurytemora carolleeae]|eukprot:XP_023345342.1 uncharacterized protein LOC111714465 isoform X2 [Eurytemora affinis]